MLFHSTVAFRLFIVTLAFLLPSYFSNLVASQMFNCLCYCKFYTSILLTQESVSVVTTFIARIFCLNMYHTYMFWNKIPAIKVLSFTNRLSCVCNMNLSFICYKIMYCVFVRFIMLYLVTVLFLVLNLDIILPDRNYLYFVFGFVCLRSQSWLKTQIDQV